MYVRYSSYVTVCVSASVNARTCAERKEQRTRCMSHQNIENHASKHHRTLYHTISIVRDTHVHKRTSCLNTKKIIEQG